MRTLLCHDIKNSYIKIIKQVYVDFNCRDLKNFIFCLRIILYFHLVPATPNEITCKRIIIIINKGHLVYPQ